jgi:proline iminopeptidase
VGAIAPPAREAFVRSGTARLYVRDVGRGRRVIVLHGGPDFDHAYLLPELDALADSVRLVYYDQRGRGRSVDGTAHHEVTITSEVEDLEAVRRSIGDTPVAVLGHSWGGLLAMEHAIRFPAGVSHLILMNTAPCSHAGMQAVRQELARRKTPAQTRRMQELARSQEYLAGDLDADAEYYRLHFASALRAPARLEDLVRRLRIGSTPEGVVRAREIEQRLYDQTWWSESYDLTPSLRRVQVPVLVLHGDHDFIPVDIAAAIAAAIPGAELRILPNCGHFAYLDQLDEVRRQVTAFFADTGRHP